MKASDYIVDFLVKKGVSDVFGYPGGSVTNLVDSFHKRSNEIKAHVTYHEQGAAFAACGYAQIAGKIGVAYATGGPGATNLITGIGHAFYDSIPLICLTGNVNVYESKGNMKIRQRAFQESDIISVVSPLTKYCAYVEDVNKLPYYLNQAYDMAMSGRKGPVLLDLPMNVLRENVENPTYSEDKDIDSCEKECIRFKKLIIEAFRDAKRPCFILGNALKFANPQKCSKELMHSIVHKYGIPYVTSMIAFDVAGPSKLNYGFLGAYGHRTANIVAEKSDLIISIGSRLDIRQIGVNREKFAPNSKIIRVDIDENELEYKVHSDDISIKLDVVEAVNILNEIEIENTFDEWISICDDIRKKLANYDDKLPNEFVTNLSEHIPAGTIITTDVGQNQVWVSQSFRLKENQTAVFCGGFGAMGHALPAAIGAYYGANSTKKIICICGDGGLQMNIQELQFVAREHIPIKIIVFNNYSLGMIRHFQEIYFDNRYADTTKEGGYTTPDFCGIGKAYGIESHKVLSMKDMDALGSLIENDNPCIVEICISEDTYVFPKLEFGKPNYDQQPLIDREMLNQIMKL